MSYTYIVLLFSNEATLVETDSTCLYIAFYLTHDLLYTDSYAVLKQIHAYCLEPIELITK